MTMFSPYGATGYGFEDTGIAPLDLGTAPNLTPEPFVAQTSRPTFQQSNTARNVALLGAGLQALGGIGQVIYGGRQTRAQAEENARAVGKANLISILTKQNVAANPATISSGGNRTSQLLANVGTSLTSLGSQMQSYRDSEYKLKLADEAAEIAAQRARREEDQYKRERLSQARSDAMARGKASAINQLRIVAASADSPEIENLSKQDIERHQLKTFVQKSVVKETILPALMQSIAEGETPSSYSDEDRYAAGSEGAQISGVTLTKGQYKGQTAIGKYQIMPGNVAGWSKQYLGIELTPEDLYKDPRFQEQIAYSVMEDYFDRAVDLGASTDDAIGMVATAWHSGKLSLDWRDSTTTDLGTGKATANYALEALDGVKEILGKPDLLTQNEYIAPDVLAEIKEMDALKALINPGAVDKLTDGMSEDLKSYFLAGYSSPILDHIQLSHGEYKTAVNQYNNLVQTVNDEQRNEELLNMQKAADLATQEGILTDAAFKIQKEGKEIFTKVYEAIEDSDEMKLFNAVAANYTKLHSVFDGFKKFNAETGEFTLDDYEQTFSATHQITIINTFQRLIDEATVREGDVALYMNNTSGAVGKVKVMLANLKSGSIITASTIKDMEEVSNALMRASVGAAMGSATSRLNAEKANFGPKGAFKDIAPENFDRILEQGITELMRAKFKPTIGAFEMDGKDYDYIDSERVPDSMELNALLEGQLRDLYPKGWSTEGGTKQDQEKARKKIQGDTEIARVLFSKQGTTQNGLDNIEYFSNMYNMPYPGLGTPAQLTEEEKRKIKEEEENARQQRYRIGSIDAIKSDTLSTLRGGIATIDRGIQSLAGTR